VFGCARPTDLGHVGALVLFAAAMGWLAVMWMRRRLID
jgi:hypothetical protein